MAASFHVVRGQRILSNQGKAIYSTTSHDNVQLTVFQNVARCGKKPCTSKGVAMAPAQNCPWLRDRHSSISMGMLINIVSRYTG